MSYVVSFHDPATWAAMRAGRRDLLDWWNAKVAHKQLAENAMDEEW